MKKKILFITLILLLSILFIMFLTSDKTYGFDNENELKIIDLNLLYSNDKDKLTENVLNFINLIDDSLFSSMNNHEINFNLNDDYNFMTKFAINYIINNKNYYIDNIKQFEEFKIEKEGQIFVTNEYVGINNIYDITSSVFNKHDYFITNNDLKIVNNYVSLINFDNKVDMKIEYIKDIKTIDNIVKIDIKYKNIEYIYTYEFSLVNNNLFLVNVDVGV